MKQYENGIVREMSAKEIAELATLKPALDYKEYVNALIRQRYTISDELALQRQREEKAEEFLEYYAYCEECKARAKKQMEGDA